jgi:hypothetical protein
LDDFAPDQTQVACIDRDRIGAVSRRDAETSRREKPVSLIITGDVERMARWADRLVEQTKPRLTSPMEREYEYFVDSLANFIRDRGDDFKVITETIEAADQGDPVAYGALERRFHEILDEHRLPPGSLNDFMRRAGKKDSRGRYGYEDYRRNVGLMVMVRLVCQAFSLPPTRNREARRALRPCACSVVADALQRAGIDNVGESRLANLSGRQGKISTLMVDAWQGAYLSALSDRVPK